MRELDPGTRQDVSDVLVRYATAIDRRDWLLFRTCFTEDCFADYGDIGVWEGVEAITGWMSQVHDSLGHTMHRITNQTVWAIAEDRVAARSYVHVLIRNPDNGGGLQSYGFYDDELARTGEGGETGEGWRIARRHFTMVHSVEDAAR